LTNEMLFQMVVLYCSAAMAATEQ